MQSRKSGGLYWQWGDEGGGAKGVCAVKVRARGKWFCIGYAVCCCGGGCRTPAASRFSACRLIGFTTSKVQ